MGELFWKAIVMIFAIIIILLSIGTVILTIIAYIMYGNKPISEVPSWALTFMFNRGGK